MSISREFQPLDYDNSVPASLIRSCLFGLALALWFGAGLLGQAATTVSNPSTKGANELYLSGLALVKQGKLDQAVTAFQSALEKNPTNCSFLDALGGTYSLKGDLESAKKYFLKCLEQDPAFVPALKNLAITEFSTGRYEEATAEFRKLSEASPQSAPVANLFLGIIAEKNSDHSQAARFLEHSGDLLYEYPEALLSLAEAEFQLGNPQTVQEVLIRLETAHEVTPSQYAEAIRILKDLGAQSPSSNTLNLLAHIAQRSGDLQLAMQSLREAAKLDPTREDNYLDFSTICADYGNYPLALEAADIGLEHIPNSYRLLIQKGVVLETLGRFDDADKILRKAGELQNDNSEALLSLAIVQTHSGQLHDAQATLTSALQVFPNNYYMHYQLGKILVQLQELDLNNAGLSTEAKHAFEQAIRCNPVFADSYYQLSKLYIRDSPKLAERNLAKCLQLDPKHAPAEYALARLYMSTGRRTAGQALIDRFERQQQAEKLKENQKPRIE